MSPHSPGLQQVLGMIPEPCVFTRTKVYSLPFMNKSSISEIKKLPDIGWRGVYFSREIYPFSKGVYDSKCIKTIITII